MWVYITAPIGAFVVILGELVTWVDFDDDGDDLCDYHGKPLLTNEELKKHNERKNTKAL